MIIKVEKGTTEGGSRLDAAVKDRYHSAHMDYTAYIPAQFDQYIFDLDGTLIDSLDDMTTAMNSTLARYGFAPVDREAVRKGIGNGAKNLISCTFCAASGLESAKLSKLIDQALPEYHAEYTMRCTDKTTLYRESANGSKPSSHKVSSSPSLPTNPRTSPSAY